MEFGALTRTTTMLARVVLAVGIGAASVAAAYISVFLALAALDGAQELPAVVGYGIPIVTPLLLPFVGVRLGLCPKGRWYGTTIGLGGALGSLVAILVLPDGGESMAELFFALPALGAFAGTFGWLPWREIKAQLAVGGTS